jgi:hypothetical protein
MKNVTILMSAFLFKTFLSFGQDCKKETDPFSNEAIKSFEWKSGGMRTLFFESRNGNATLEFRVGEIAAIEYLIAKGSPVQIKLENEDIIKMFTILDARSTVSKTTINADNSVTFSTYFLKMEITDEQIKKLAKFKVTHMQFPDLHGGLQTYDSRELRNKFERFLLEGAKCLTGGN